MTDRDSARFDEARLEEALRDLRHSIGVRSDDDIAALVRVRLERERHAPRRVWGVARSPRIAAVAALLLLVMLAVALVPAARHAVADLFGLRGERIEHRAPSVTVSTAAPESDAALDLGVVATVDQARAALPNLVIPVELGAPQRVWVRPGRPEVSLVYLDGRGRVTTLVTEFAADITPFFDKMLGANSRLEPVTVNGGRGAWVEGGDHFLFLTDARGDAINARGRVAGNALIWEQGKLTLRMEGAFDKVRALLIAQSIR